MIVLIEFKLLDINDAKIFNNYLGDYDFKTYEYSFLNLYLWRKYCKVEYSIIKNALIVKKDEEGKGSFFMQPLGYSCKDLDDIIKELIEYKQKNNKMKFLFGDIEEPFLKILEERYRDGIEYYKDINNFDYIYETEKLINLNGDKLRKRKSQYNQFVMNYDFEIKDIHDKKVAKDCIRYAKHWFINQPYKNNQLVFEVEGIEDVLNNLDYLNAIGMAVYVHGNIVGFTIGERVNSNMAIIHIEKGDTNYKGIYAFINRTFAKKYLKDIIYINRQEDIGIEGLKRAKLAYDPIRLEKKYLVNVDEV